MLFAFSVAAPAQYNQNQYSGQYSGQTAVVVTQPVVPVVQHFRESPVQMTCHFCHANIVTATEYEAGTMTWVACAIICLIG